MYCVMIDNCDGVVNVQEYIIMYTGNYLCVHTCFFLFFSCSQSS